MLLYHHCRSLDSLVYGEVGAKPEYFDPDLKDAYSWLKKEIGFYPLFLAVGVTEEDIRMTGYQNQWRRSLSESQWGKEYIKKGESPNYVLFSFKNINNGVYMDYDYWHLVLNAGYKNYQITDYEKRLIFKPSWSTGRWLKKAKNQPHSVQLITQGLFLPKADRIWVRNQKTKVLLTTIGFSDVRSRRLLVEEAKHG